MIFTSRFGALAARPKFERIPAEHDLDRELDDLLKGAELEHAEGERAN